MIAPRPCPPLLADILRSVPRRYRMPALPADARSAAIRGPAATLAIVIEAVRVALAAGTAPDPALEPEFVAALAQLIEDAVRPERGDPAFQALLMRDGMPQVREYATLAAYAERDQRDVRQSVNAIAHPAKQERAAPPLRQTLSRWHDLAMTGAWAALAQAVADDVLPTPLDPALALGRERLCEAPGLTRLIRLDELAQDARVQEYQALWARNGPRTGSAAAAAQGRLNRARGDAVEALTADALRRIADRLDQAEGEPGRYRVVTSLRVPPILPASADHAKTEWDAVLLRRATDQEGGGAPAWDICLLAEAKASVDAATTDLPRLSRGLRLLGSAPPEGIVAFETQQGTVALRGTSLTSLGDDDATVKSVVLYCCDAPAEPAPRLLNAASRMQLLCAQASMAYATQLAQGSTPDVATLTPVWTLLLHAPAWRPVREQYATLRRVRTLMVHVGDLAACAER